MTTRRKTCGARWRDSTLLRIVREPMGALGLILVALIVIGALAADITGYNPIKLAMRDRFLDPSLSHLLGTDHLGRDLFTRVLHGARIALGVAFLATAISFVGGLVLGHDRGLWAALARFDFCSWSSIRCDHSRP